MYEVQNPGEHAVTNEMTSVLMTRAMPMFKYVPGLRSFLIPARLNTGRSWTQTLCHEHAGKARRTINSQ